MERGRRRTLMSRRSLVLTRTVAQACCRTVVRTYSLDLDMHLNRHGEAISSVWIVDLLFWASYSIPVRRPDEGTAHLFTGAAQLCPHEFVIPVLGP